ncbi:MAG: GTPase family protein [Candidatus Competibacterales bacterium]
MVPALWRQLWSPKVDDTHLVAHLEGLRRELPLPLFWLLGKAQSGKTSLIRALTGDDRARIGDGIRPCTRHAYLYDFPSRENAFIQFLDTRGLGESHYDPTEDLAAFATQAHLLIVVMKATDLAQGAVMEAFWRLWPRNRWPVIVLQTALHEGYVAPTDPHPQPYPFRDRHGASPLPTSLPGRLAESLEVQRRWFDEVPAQFVAVDFTLPEDGYQPEHYGLEALWEAIETALPQGVAAMVRDLSQGQRDLQRAFARTADAHITGYALAAAGAGAIPLPLVDLPLVGLIQGKMAQSVASIYNQPFDRRNLGELLGALGLGLASQWGRRELVKVVPVYGPAVASVLTGAATYALGKTLAVYFSAVHRGDTPDPALFRDLYQEQFAVGRRRLGLYLSRGSK